jgi:hypothetical protein
LAVDTGLEALVPQTLAKLLYLAILAVWLVPPNWRGLTTPVMRGAIRCGENSLAIYCLGARQSHCAGRHLGWASDADCAQSRWILVMIAATTLLSSIRVKPRRQPRLF